MAITAHFKPKSMNAAQYDEALRRLEAAGAAAPAGRIHHLCFGAGDKLEVIDVWETPESFQQFGATLGPILGDIGIDAGEPTILPLYNAIAG